MIVLASTLAASLSFPSTAMAGDLQGTTQRVNDSREPAAEEAEESTTEEAPAETGVSDDARAAYDCYKAE